MATMLHETQGLRKGWGVAYPCIMDQKQPEDLWNVRKAATFLGWAPRTVYVKVKSGEIPHLRVGKKKKTIRFEPEVLRAYARGHV